MSYSYEQIKNILSFAVAFKPSSAFPLDARSMFGSKAEAEAAALTAKPAGSAESIYYYGQTFTVVENDTVTDYKVQVDGTLKPIGSEIFGDNKTISLGENGVLSFKNFGTKYYAYKPADVVIDGEYTTVDELPATANDGEYALVGENYYKYNIEGGWVAAEEGFVPTATSTYVETNGWKAGLEPKVVTSENGTDYEIAWFEPSTTTVEGLSSIVSDVQTRVDTLNAAVSKNKTDGDQAITDERTARESADTTLSNRITKNEQDISKLNGDASTEGSVRHTVSKIFAELLEGNDETMDTLEEFVDWAMQHPDEVIQLSNDVTKNANAISAINTLLGAKLPDGANATNVIDYIVELVAAEKTRAEEAEGDLSDRLDDAEAVISGLGTASKNNTEDFATAAQGVLASTAVQQQNIITSKEDLAEDISTASTEKVISEKLLFELLTWKEEM